MLFLDAASAVFNKCSKMFKTQAADISDKWKRYFYSLTIYPNYDDYSTKKSG
jgi:hypothetical protein